MRIIDLAPENKELFAICLEDWSAEAKEAGPRRGQWVERFLERGLRAKLAVDDSGKVTVTSFVNGWCLAGDLTCERAKRAAAELGDRVVFREIDTSEHAMVAACGQADALFIDGKQVRTGPPPSYEKLRALIEKRLWRLK